MRSQTNSTPEIVARLAEQLIYDYHEDYYPDVVVSEQSSLHEVRDLLDQTLLTDATSDITNKDRALLGSLKAMILEMQRPDNKLANKFTASVLNVAFGLDPRWSDELASASEFYELELLQAAHVLPAEIVRSLAALKVAIDPQISPHALSTSVAQLARRVGRLGRAFSPRCPINHLTSPHLTYNHLSIQFQPIRGVWRSAWVARMFRTSAPSAWKTGPRAQLEAKTNSPPKYRGHGHLCPPN